MHYMKSELTSSSSKVKIAIYHELGKPRARSSRCCGLAFTQVKKHLTWLLCSGIIHDHLRLLGAPSHAFGRSR